MSEKIYNWKRFWCSRTSQVNLGDRGYLYDPESEYGHLFNPELVGLEAIADIPCLILLGEPGIGKSQEVEKLVEYTRKTVEPPHRILERNLRSCNNLETYLIQNQDFIDWIKGEHRLYLFLDSLDEGMLTVANLATQLVDEFSQDKYSDKLDRLYIRIACRTAVFPRILEEGIEKLWEKTSAIYELAPLRYVDVENAATKKGLDSQTFLSEVWDKTLVPLAIKPLTLRFLLNTYKRNGGQFPSDQTLCNFYLDGCRLLCEEDNRSRQAAKQIGLLEPDPRLIIAARIAAITIFSNRLAIWTGSSQGEVPAEDVLIKQLILGNEFFNGRPIDVTESAIREVLGTGLFLPRGSNRIGWAHQTYAEFLAAWYLKQREVPLSTVKKLIFSSEDPENKLIPQLYETAAWLASMRADVFQEIILTNPDILLQSDIPADANTKLKITDSLLMKYENKEIFDRRESEYGNYAKLNCHGLAAKLLLYISDHSKQVDTRELAINIANSCKCVDLQEELVSLILDPSNPIHLRSSAARTIAKIGNEDYKLKLKHLSIEPIATDKDDQLKGCILRAVWPDLLTTEELFTALQLPKRRNLIGSYSIFINSDLVRNFQGDDLVVALKWLEKQGLRDAGHPFSQLGDNILLKAWEFFELLEVIQFFTRIAFIQWKGYENIVICDNGVWQQNILLASSNVRKFHKLIEQSVLMISKMPEQSCKTSDFIPREILVLSDIIWMLKQLQKTISNQEKQVWANLIQVTFRNPELMPEEAKMILEITRVEPALYNEFLFWIKTIDLDSIEAIDFKKNYLQEQNRQNTLYLSPSPEDRIMKCLESFESGNLNQWINLNNQLTLLPTSKHYGHICRQPDIIYLPGWENADPHTRSRIVNAANVFIQSWQSDNSGDVLYEIDVVAYKALRLILSEKYDCLSIIPMRVWHQLIRIMPLIYKYTSDSRFVAPHHTLIKESYIRLPDEMINTLILSIDRDNLQYGDVYILDAFQECWDDKSLSAIFNKLTDKALSPKSLEKLFAELMKNDSTKIQAKDFAKSLISLPLPSDENDQEKVLIASRLLIKYSDPSTWSFIWPLMEQNPSFGCEVIKLSNNYYNIQFNLTEMQLASLYLWLVQQYPYSEDPNYDNEVGAHAVTDRECIGRMRDSVLSQLIELGTIQACKSIELLIQQLPEVTWLSKNLIIARENMRRKTWRSPTPEEILQLVVTNEPSNLELQDTLNSMGRNIPDTT
jgi:predicted NACHT family NTPase